LRRRIISMHASKGLAATKSTATDGRPAAHGGCVAGAETEAVGLHAPDEGGGQVSPDLCGAGSPSWNLPVIVR
jgi:hypothetical protein